MATAEASQKRIPREFKPVDLKKLNSFKFPSLGWGDRRSIKCLKISPPSAGVTRSPVNDPPKQDPSFSVSPPSNPSEKKNGKELPWNLRKKKQPWHKDDPYPSARNGEVLKLGPKSDSGKKKRKNPLSIGLSAKEIEADFVAMMGNKPPKNPKKRPKKIQNQINEVFPGMYLSQTKITPDLYEVEEEK